MTATAMCLFDGAIFPDAWVTISQKINGRCHAEAAGPIRSDRVIIGRIANGQQLVFHADGSIEALVEMLGAEGQ